MSSKPRFFYGYVIVGVCFLMFVSVMGLASSFSILFKALIDDMGWSRTATSGAYSLNSLIIGICGIIGGWLSDKLGPRKVMTVFGIISIAGYLLISQMHHIWEFYLYFGILAAMGGNVYVPALSTVARWFVQKRSLMSGIAFSGAGFGSVITPLLVSWFIREYNWRLSLVVMSGIILVTTILAAILLRTDPKEMGLFPYGADKKATEKTHIETASVSFIQALKTSEFWVFAVILACYGFCFMSFQVHIVAHAIDMGISSTSAALIITVMGVATIAGQLGLGSIADKTGYKQTFIFGLGCIVAGVSLMLFAREFWMFGIFAVLMGLAFGNCSTQESPITAWLFGLGSHGTILGAFAFTWTIGASVGPLVFGAIYDTQGSYQSAFYIAVVVSVIALLLSFFLKRSAIEKKT